LLSLQLEPKAQQAPLVLLVRQVLQDQLALQAQLARLGQQELAAQ